MDETLRAPFEHDLDADLGTWLRAMPKAELHLHLDGSLRPATALDLARQRGIDLLPHRSSGHPAWRGPRVEDVRDLLVAPARVADQVELLRYFDLPTALLQDREALERMAAELVEDVSAEGTRYAEIRWAPSLHTRAGLSLRDGIAAVADGARRAAARTGISVRLIAVALRTHEPSTAAAVARAAVEARPDGLSGFDLAGRERDAPDPVGFGEAFDIARAGGLGITCHAGEWGGPAQVRRALALAPWRIAHGAPAADDPVLMADLRAAGVTLDLCPTSNLQAGIGSDDAGAPLARLLRAGVPVTISTDDRTVSDLTLVRELARCVTRMGLEPREIAGAVRQAYRAAFLHDDEPLRGRLQGAFEAWLQAHPGPGMADADRQPATP